jgi:hypothetical protein
MAEQSPSRLLELVVTPNQPRLWEWLVICNGETIANGFEDGLIKAKFEGHSAMFHLLASGWQS